MGIFPAVLETNCAYADTKSTDDIHLNEIVAEAFTVTSKSFRRFYFIFYSCLWYPSNGTAGTKIPIPTS